MDFENTDGAVWPVELQDESTWSKHGEIRNWDCFPEFLDGDFCTLKDVHLGDAPKDPALAWDLQRRIREFRPSNALRHLTEIYQFWIAYADIDGYRLDTVKHMEPGAVRYFATAVHEFAISAGKENFYIIGEITGGRSYAASILDSTGLDAALGINDIPDKLEFMVKGWRSPGNPDTDEQEGYFDLFATVCSTTSIPGSGTASISSPCSTITTRLESGTSSVLRAMISEANCFCRLCLA